MSSSFLAPKLLYLTISSPTPYHSHYHHRHQLSPTIRHCLSISAPSHSHRPTELPFIAHYLISSFDFSPDRALKYSANSHLTPIKSSEGPDSVVTFLKDTGLSYNQIQAAVSLHPIILGYNVEKILKPKVLELMDGGFSREQLVHLIRYNPAAFYRKNTLSRLLFWRNFVGNNDHVLLKIIQRNSWLFKYDIDKHILPVINLLKEYVLSNRDIMSLLVGGTRSFTSSPDSLNKTLELIEELGISRGSRMFVYAFKSVGGYSKDTIKRKMEFFMVTYGWSEEDVCAAFMKFPWIFALPEKKVKTNMDFLIRKAGFEPREIAFQPVLLGCSVQRLLIPRYTVLSALEAKGLKGKCSLLTVCNLSEKAFLARYVLPYEKDVPGLAQAYAGNVLV